MTPQAPPRRSSRSAFVAALMLAWITLATSTVDAQRGGTFRSSSVGSVRGISSRTTHRDTYDRFNPAAPTPANTGSVRQGRAFGEAETEARAPAFRPKHVPTLPESTTARPGPRTAKGVGVGSVIPEPQSVKRIIVKRKRYDYADGLFLDRRVRAGEVTWTIVEAPEGAVVDEIPVSSERVELDGSTYHVFGDTWFRTITRRGRDAYMVVPRPTSDR